MQSMKQAEELHENAHRVIHHSLNVIHHIRDIKHDPYVLLEAAGNAARRVHVIARREGVRMRERSKKHFHTDQKFLQPRRHIIRIICCPLLRGAKPQLVTSSSPAVKEVNATQIMQLVHQQ